MPGNDPFNVGRSGGYAGSGTDIEEFRRGQNARQIDLANAKSANASYWPKDRGGSGGGAGCAMMLPLLMLGSVLVWVSIPSLVSAFFLRLMLRVPEGMPEPTWWRLFKAACFVTLVGSVPAGGALAGVYFLQSQEPQFAYLRTGELKMLPEMMVACWLLVLLLAGGLTLKLCLREFFPDYQVMRVRAWPPCRSPSYSCCLRWVCSRWSAAARSGSPCRGGSTRPGHRSDRLRCRAGAASRTRGRG